MSNINLALRRTLISGPTNPDYCCICLKQLEDDCKLCQIGDEVYLDTGYSRDIYEILLTVLGDEVLSNLTTDTICLQCTESAIKSYNFISMCKHNTKQLNNVVTSLLCYNDNNIPDSNFKSLFLVSNVNKINDYYDKKISKQDKSTLLKRLKHLTRIQDGVQRFSVEFEYDDGSVFTNNEIATKRIDKRLKSINLSDILHNTKDLSKIKCKICSKIYPTTWNLKQHYLRIHAQKKFKCTECSRSFGALHLLKRHKRQSHCTVVCIECGKVYTNCHSLRNHELSHKTRLVCKTCGKTYKGKQSFNNHITLQLCKKMRKSNSESQFVCDYCQKRYSTKTALSIHIRLEHENGKALLCQWCNKKFSSRSRLQDHIITHTKQKNFSCDVCNGEFSTKASLVYHTRIHTGERPYECQFCDKRFLSASRRSEHVKRHHTAPSIECDTCHLKFKGKASLLRHKKKCDVSTLFDQSLFLEAISS